MEAGAGLQGSPTTAQAVKVSFVGLISFLIDPTVYWALDLCPDRGRPTLNGWWAPAVQR